MLFTSLTNLQKRKHSAISINIKKKICEYIVTNPCIKQTTVASFFNSKYDLKINRITINKIWQKREQ